MSDPSTPATPAQDSTIRTPDQRLRVFVSSTLQELAPERGAVREAVEKLRLTPVMFELGARSHPPRDLYRAYLQQSQVFVGVYWERYGWVAPGESVSGLEDEYNLSGTLPKLIYVKAPSPKRELRLDALLDRVRGDDDASYKSFNTPEELRNLLADDLALLLTERFELSAVLASVGRDARLQAGALPSPLTRLIGREAELTAVDTLMARDDVRLITLVGPGGIGKTRLVLSVAAAWQSKLRDGARFVSLAAVNEAVQVPLAVAQALGLRDLGRAEALSAVQAALADRQMLLVLDNFEQVPDAAVVLSEWLSHAPGLRILVASRSLLHLTGEHSVELGPLALPDLGRPLVLAEQLALSSVQLFVERARAVKPDFELTEDNVGDVARICFALDGVPLALELAAARVRMLPPAALLARLDRGLGLLSGGASDLPERQQTLRNTIDWSVRLLPEGEQQLFAQLGVFSRSFTLAAAEGVCGPDTPDVLGSLAGLVDGSLVRQEARESELSFSWLGVVREYALELLTESGKKEELARRHAGYYHGLAAEARSVLRGPEQGAWLDRLDFAYDNLRTTMRFDLDQHDLEAAVEFAWNLYVLWWVGGHLGEVHSWMNEVLAAKEPLPPLTCARALYFASAVSFWQQVDARIVPGLEESVALFHQQGEESAAGLASISLGLAQLAFVPPDVTGATAVFEAGLAAFRGAKDEWGESLVLLSRGRVALFRGEVDGARRDFDDSLTLTRRGHNDLGGAIALNHLGWTSVLLGNTAEAGTLFRDGLTRSARLRHDEGIAYGLEGLLAVSVLQGDVARVARLLGATQVRREQLGLRTTVNAAYYEPALNALRARSDAAAFDTEAAIGRALNNDDAVSYALDTAGAQATQTGEQPHELNPA